MVEAQNCHEVGSPKPSSFSIYRILKPSASIPLSTVEMAATLPHPPEFTQIPSDSKKKCFPAVRHIVVQSRNFSTSPASRRWKLVRNTVKAVGLFQTTEVQQLQSAVWHFLTFKGGSNKGAGFLCLRQQKSFISLHVSIPDPRGQERTKNLSLCSKRKPKGCDQVGYASYLRSQCVFFLPNIRT